MPAKGGKLVDVLQPEASCQAHHRDEMQGGAVRLALSGSPTELHGQRLPTFHK